MDCNNSISDSSDCNVEIKIKATPTPPKEGLKKHSLGEGGLLSDKILYESNVFITPGGIFGTAGEKYVRVSLCAKEEKIEDAIKRIRLRG